MKTKVFASVILLSIIGLASSCGKLKSAQSDDGKPAVTVQTQQLNDNSSFTMSNGERCTITADATIDYPVSSQGASLSALQKVFANYVLESGDSLSLQEAMRQVVANSMHQYDFMQEPVDKNEADNESEDLTTIKYATSTRVTPIYNKHGVVTFERVDVVKKNDKVTSITHRYYSFDAENQTFIDLNRLFREDALTDVCQLLRQQLLRQNNASGNEQLNDLGYFNVENLTVTSNFYFDDKGVTWSYLPNELAVEAIGEPKITISYGDLKDALCDGSIIERIR